ncbi:superoxide dismutase family protein [Ottowia sp. SB7-C50]|jgi:Cu-Zn family superoxide dismutase|uniref:superoxide dismutase family protein n=1 Tax=Ottowia sp. SB7-C50 TaxID=3081231 RepID=UPI002954310E|nr:superoxide dismutase family protein [Ottowia sp. SB7-C50]WOP15528.1 superoxide dismutase family protein [Ottowia sp. SB7-C50]
MMTSPRFLRLAVALAALGAVGACTTTRSDSATPVARAQAELRATTTAQPVAGKPVQGLIRFAQMTDGAVRITGQVNNLAPNARVGFHIHENGVCSGDGTAAGGHFNPTGRQHATPGQGHAGDLPMLQADATGSATVQYVSHDIQLTGPQSIVNRGLIVHASPDDYRTQPTGNAGARVACAVIEPGH